MVSNETRMPFANDCTTSSSLLQGYIPMCKQSTAAQPKKEPEKIEVFVDGKPVQVEPNTTVLQVESIGGRSPNQCSRVGVRCCGR